MIDAFWLLTGVLPPIGLMYILLRSALGDDRSKMKPLLWKFEPLITLTSMYGLTAWFAMLYWDESGLETSGNLIIGVLMILAYTIGSILGKDVIMHENFGIWGPIPIPIFWVMMIDWVFELGFIF